MLNSPIYRQLMQHMEEAVCMTDEDNTVIYANSKMCYLTGRKFDELVGQSANIFLDTASRKKVAHVDSEERRKGESSSYAITIVTKLGNKIPVTLNGTPLPEGGTIGIMTDMREIKAREQNEKILYSAVQYSTDAIIMCDQKGIITFWNKGAQIIFGFKHDDMVGKTLSSIFAKKDITALIQDKEILTRYDLEGKHKNKSKMRISVTQTPIFNEKKTIVVSYLLVCRDITNHKKIENEIEEKYQKIREAYENLGTVKRQSDYIFELLNMYENNYNDLKSICDFIVASIIMLSHADGCELRIYNPKDGNINTISHFGFSQDWSGKKKNPFKGSLTEVAYKHGRPLKIIDIMQEPKFQAPGLARKNGMTSLLLIPLISKGKFIGSLALFTKADKKLEIFENEFIEKYAKVVQMVVAGSV